METHINTISEPPAETMHVETADHLRLALLTDSFLPHAGGSRVYYYNLFTHIAATYGDEVTVLTKKVPGWREFDAKHSFGNFLIKRKFRPVPYLHYQQLPKILLPLMHTLCFAIGHPIDVLHCGDLYPPGLIGVFLKKTMGVPFIAYCHGEEVTQTEQLRFQPKVRDYIYRSADAVVANSSFAVQLLQRIGVAPSRIHKITPGIDTDRIHPAPREESLVSRHQTTGKVVLVTIARLIPRKGQDSVIRILPKLIRRYPNVRYLVVGKGPEENNLKRLASEVAVSEFVEFVGFVPDSQINAYYNLADIVVMPNREERDGDLEGFGMVFLEGNAAGKPVVGGRSGGAPEAVVHGETGMLVNSLDEDELLRTLGDLVASSDLRNRLGAAGLKRAREEFGWNSRAAKLRKISEAVIEARTRKRRD